MDTKKYRVFNIGFWFLAALILFFNDIEKSEGHRFVPILRYSYLMVLGPLTTAALTLFYNGDWFSRSSFKLLWAFASALFLAIFMALILNPLTYLLLDINIHAEVYKVFSTGTLYFVLLYLLWSALYFHLKGGIEKKIQPRAPHVFTFDHNKERISLRETDIECLVASGDYVEIVTAGRTYLKKASLSSLEHDLDKQLFYRVHRSVIINSSYIRAIKTKGGGCFHISLKGGKEISSSRSFKAIVESLRA